jgi:hypothetical protein
MPEPRPHGFDCPGGRNTASAHGDEPVSALSAARAADGGKNSVSIRQAEAILAGLPAPVMDELVEDLAEAVAAILLSQAATDADEKDDASGSLR